MTAQHTIPLTRPWMDELEAEAARQVLVSGWVTQGPQVAAFERDFAEWVDADHACAVSSCTAALHLALLAIGAETGDEIVTVSHTFVATANAVRQCGAMPVFVDIDPATFNMDPTAVSRAITARTRGILCVHQMGMPCDLSAIVGIARRHGLPVIEDAACAAGSEIRLRDAWQRIGRPHGDIACFSFHPRKLLTTGEGGMLTTHHAEWDARFRRWRQHGMSVPDSVRHGSSEVVFESYGHLGYNYRMTDIQAAVGRVQLGRLPEVVARRRGLADRYRELLSAIDGLGLPTEPAWARSNWQSFCVRLPDGVDQRAVMQFMLEHGVATRRGIMCCHQEAAHADVPVRARLDASREARDRSIVLPLFHELTAEQQQHVATLLEHACRHKPCHTSV